MGKFIDLTGQKFGRLTVIERVDDYISPNGQHQTQWLCKCECGIERVVCRTSLKKGSTKSCGCSRKKHGVSKTRVYRIWECMRQRCGDKHNKKYSIYGGRGIKVCEEWQAFLPFFNWAMANGYKDDLTIDRIDSNGNYEPSNCRWATYKEQNNNTRRNHIITYNGETHTMAQWAEIKNISYQSLAKRLNVLNWSIERALTTK